MGERASILLEPTYPKPDISLRAIRTYSEIVAPLMLPFGDGRILAPIGDDLPDVTAANAFAITDADVLAARSRALAGWGRSEQSLPQLG
jgi:hypothetical protein